jgi:hypothetical protein
LQYSPALLCKLFLLLYSPALLCKPYLLAIQPSSAVIFISLQYSPVLLSYLSHCNTAQFCYHIYLIAIQPSSAVISISLQYSPVLLSYLSHCNTAQFCYHIYLLAIQPVSTLQAISPCNVVYLCSISHISLEYSPIGCVNHIFLICVTMFYVMSKRPINSVLQKLHKQR